MVISIQLAVTCFQVTRSASAALGRIAPTLMSSGTTTPVTAFTLRTDSTRPSSISTTLRSMRLAIIFTLARLAFILRRRLFFLSSTSVFDQYGAWFADIDPRFFVSPSLSKFLLRLLVLPLLVLSLLPPFLLFLRPPRHLPRSLLTHLPPL